jgi:hypothetical protein
MKKAIILFAIVMFGIGLHAQTTKTPVKTTTTSGYDKKEFPDDENSDDEETVETPTALLGNLGDVLKAGEEDPDAFPEELKGIFAKEGFAFKNADKKMSSDGKFVEHHILHFAGVHVKYFAVGGIMTMEIKCDSPTIFAKIVTKLGHSTDSYMVSRNSKASAFKLTYLPVE